MGKLPQDSRKGTGPGSFHLLLPSIFIILLIKFNVMVFYLLLSKKDKFISPDDTYAETSPQGTPGAALWWGAEHLATDTSHSLGVELGNKQVKGCFSISSKCIKLKKSHNQKEKNSIRTVLRKTLQILCGALADTCTTLLTRHWVPTSVWERRITLIGGRSRVSWESVRRRGSLVVTPQMWELS